MSLHQAKLDSLVYFFSRKFLKSINKVLLNPYTLVLYKRKSKIQAILIYQF